MATRCVVNGVFDLVHIGHTRLLAEAKARFDWVLAALDSDEVVSAEKRNTIIPFDERAEIVGQLRSVNMVVQVDFNYGPFARDPRSVDAFFKEWNLDALVCGADDQSYVDYWFGHLSRTGRVIVLPRTPGIDTSLIVQRCKMCSDVPLAEVRK